MRILKKYQIYLINIIFVLGIFLLILFLNNMSPFGDKILGAADSIYQYKPLLFNYITKLRDGTLLNYSFNNGLGNPFIFEFAYYLSSPLNLVALLFKTADGMLLSTIIIKLIIGTIIMTFYTKSKTSNPYIIFISTISYLFSGFFLTYYSFFTWLDIFILFPLFQKGLEDLLNKQKPNLYIVSLALVTISNFYLAFSIYIYTIIYFIIYVFFYKKDTKLNKINSLNRIIIYTILTFIMIFIYVYILFSIYIKTGLNVSDGISPRYTVSFVNLIKSLLYGNKNMVGINSDFAFPNMALNHFVLINTIFFFLNKRISFKDKKYALITIILILSTLYIKPIDYVLNMFHYVRGFPFRYSYIFSLLTINIFIKNLKSLEEKDIKKLLFTIPLIIIFILITWKSTENEIIIINVCSLLAYTSLLILYSNNKWHNLLLCLVIVTETFTVGYYTLPQNNEKEAIDYSIYQKENTKYRQNYGLYYGEPLNSNLYYNYKVTYQFNSLAYNRSSIFTYKIGCNSDNSSSIICTDKNDITNMLLNIKNDNYYLEKIFAVNKEITLTDSGFKDDTKTNIENYIKGLTGIENIFDKEILYATEDENNYIFHTDYNFFLIEIPTEDNGIAYSPMILNDFVQSKKYGKNYATIYVLKKNKLDEIYSYLSKNQIKYTYYNDNKIQGKIHVDKNQLIYTSIPYDPSWEIKIDGQKIKQPLILIDSLIGIETTPGDHTISMEYKNNDYIGPTIVSISTIIIYIYYCIKKKKV